MVRQPLRYRGLGIRGQVDTAPVAFIGALKQSVTAFAGELCICPQVGEGSSTGETRSRVIEKRENLRGLLLRRALGLHPDQQARPVLMLPQLDKLSMSWLLALPGPCSGLSSPVFSEAMCSLLCLPSPACRDRLGEHVRWGVVVDRWGDNVMSAALPGDTWRTRHDEVKSAINGLCVWSKLPVTCEVFNLFAHLIPQEALNRMERGRRRQAILPDFRLAMPDPVTGICRRLAELKVITCCSSRYQVRDRQKAVDKRAGLLSGEYRRKAKNVDRDVIGINGEMGPIERKLGEYGDLLGLVVGAWSEASEDLHNLVQVIAQSRVNSVGLARGRPPSESELGTAVGQVRRRLSVACLRANMNCLLSRMSLLGESSRQAQGRRQGQGWEEERMRREMQAQWLGRIRHHGIAHRGAFFMV